jgi:hypothetical protein
MNAIEDGEKQKSGGSMEIYDEICFKSLTQTDGGRTNQAF